MSRPAPRVVRTLSTLGLTALGATGMAALGLGLGVGFLASPLGNRLVAERVRVAAQDAMVEGRFRLGGIQTDTLRDLEIRGLVIEDATGKEVVAVDRLALGWRPEGVLEGELWLGRVRGDGIRVDLATMPDGNLDLMALFGVPAPDPTAPPEPFMGIGIDLEATEVSLQGVSLRMTEPSGAETLALRGGLSTPVEIRGRDLRMPALLLDATLTAPIDMSLHAEGGLALAAGAVELSDLRVHSDRSRVRLDGVIARAETAPAFGLDVAVAPLAAEDVAGLAGASVLHQDLDLRGRLHGGLEALRLDAHVTGGDAGQVELGAVVGLESDPMSWTLDAQTEALSLDALLVDVSEPVRLQGRYRVGAVGVDWPDGLDATVQATGGAQVLWGEPIEGLRLDAQVSGGVVHIDQLEGRHPLGRVAATGRVDVPGETAALQLTAAVPALGRLQRFGAPPIGGGARFVGPLDVDWGEADLRLDARGQLGVRGLDVSGLQVAALSGPTSVSVRGERVEVAGTLAVEGVEAEGLEVAHADVELDLGWDPRAGTEGQVALAAAGVSVGDGAVRVSHVVGAITATVPPDAPPAATADLAIADLRLGPAEVEAEGGPVEAVLTGDRVVVQFDLARRTQPFFSGRIRGDLGLQEWVAEDLVVAPLAEQPFEAEGPVRFSLADGGFRGLEGRLLSDAGDLTVRGDLLPPGEGASDLTVRLEDLDLAAVGQIHDLYRPPVRGLRLRGLSGDVDLALTLSGEEAYAVDLAVLVDGLNAPPGVGAEIRDLDLQLGVQGDLERPRLRLRAAHDSDLLADLRGEVPLSWSEGVPAPDCASPVSMDALLAPGELGRLHEHLPDLPELDALGSASVTASGPLCDPEVRLVSTWSVPVGPGGERIELELDAERRGDQIEIWGALEEGLARRLSLEGGAATPASQTLAALLDEGEAGDPARPEAWVGALDLRVVPLGIPLTRLVEISGADTLIQGRLQGGLSVSGTVGQPVVAGALFVDRGRVGSVPVSEAQLVVFPSGEEGYRIDGRMGFGRDNALGDLAISGDVPLHLDLGADLDTMLSQRGLAVKIDGVGVPLSLLEGVSSDIEAASGQLTLGGFISGSLADPMPNFVVGVRDGMVVHRDLGVRYADMELDLRANGHHLDLARLSLSTTERTARMVGKRVIGAAQPGSLAATGSASIGTRGLEGLKLAVEAENLWLSNRPDARFRVDGQVEVAGDWPRLSIGGDVEMVEGNLNLDERVFMDSGDLALDPSITVLRPQGVGRGVAIDESSIFEDVDLDVHLDLHRGLGLRAAVPIDDSMGREVTALSTVRLDADLASQDLWVRTKDGQLVVNGEVELRSGDVTLMGSTFDLAADHENALHFISDDYLEPTIDLAAQKVTRSYGTVEARVTGSPSAPEVAFENAEYPDETDVMSILLFGKPAAELSDSEGQAGAGMLSTAIGMVARGSINRALGGGNLQTEIEFDGDSFRVGHPLGDRVFASLEWLTQAEEDEGTYEMTLEWLISRWLYAEVASGDGGNSADLYWRWRF